MPRPKAAPLTVVDDPLADLRDDDTRYPAPEDTQDAAGAPQGDRVAPGADDPLASLLFARMEAVMALVGEPTVEQLAMMEALANETAQELAPLVTPALSWEAAIETWHDNTVAVGFLHKGGRCGCRYLAQMILGA